MRDYLTFGSSPVEEDCVQVGAPDYYEKYRDECNRYRQLLLNRFGNPPGSAKLIIKAFEHDFGTYYEVCIAFNDENEEETNYAYMLENNIPARWEDN